MYSLITVKEIDCYSFIGWNLFIIEEEPDLLLFFESRHANIDFFFLIQVYHFTNQGLLFALYICSQFSFLVHFQLKYLQTPAHVWLSFLHTELPSNPEILNMLYVVTCILHLLPF